MNRLIIFMAFMAVILWAFNAGTMYHMLERIEGPRETVYYGQE